MQADPATLIAIGDMSRPIPWLALAGFVLIAALDARRVPGAITIGILATAAAGFGLGLSEFHGVASLPPSIAPTWLAMDFGRIVETGFLAVVVTFLIVDLFDTAGTLVGVAYRAGFLDREGRLPRLRQALLADSGATAVGAALGTSTTTSYIESIAGIRAGGRTRLTAAVVAVLFVLCLFLPPLAQSVSRSRTALHWAYAALKLVSGRIKDCSPAVVVLAALLVLRFVFF